MQFMKSCSVLVLALATLSAAAVLPRASYAKAYVDPEARHFAGRTTVIVVLKDQEPVPYGSRSKSNYVSVRRALQENARVSQRAVAKLLNEEQNASSAIRFKRLWIINAMIVELPTDKIALLENHPDVAGIYSNRKVSIIPDRRSTTERERADEYTYGLSMMNVPKIREEMPKVTGEGVLVGVLDTGVDAAHPDLKGKVVGFKDFVGQKNEPYDDHGHGTHVSGTIAGGKASGKAIGVAPGAKLIVGKVFSAQGGASTAAILSAMQWIADPDGNPTTPDAPALVSNSWGGGTPSPGTDPANEAFCKATTSWMKLGIFPVFAAGNSGPGARSIGLPGGCPDAFAVGATNDKDALASFSSQGPAVWKTGTLIKPNVSAPGVAVISAIPGGKYAPMSGTSMATPHVAGMMALIYQVSPKIAVGEAGALASKAAKDLGDAGNDNQYGWGRVDAYQSLKTLQRIRSNN
jgi:serine protease AprX